MNWEVRKRHCLRLSGRLKDFPDLIMMERAASVLHDVHEQDQLDGLWTLTKEYLNTGDAVKQSKNKFLL